MMEKELDNSANASGALLETDPYKANGLLPETDPYKARGQLPNGLYAPGRQKTGGRVAGTPNLATSLAQSILDENTLNKLNDMPRQDLIILIKRVGSALFGYALQSDEERREAASLKLYGLGMQSSEVHKVIPALKEWADRQFGKPSQSIDMTVKQSPVSKLTDDQLAAILANLPTNPMVIPPMPDKLW
jgi:hypothetical protein